MKLATKKFFHNVLAIAVSVCMVCTMTPSLAWATSGSGDSVSGSTEFSNSAESIIKGKIKNTNFEFESLTPQNANFVDKAAFVEAMQGNGKLTATFKDKGLPDNYTVAWYIQEVEANESFDSSQPESSSNPKVNRVSEAIKISSNDYAKADTPRVENIPTFTYPSTDGMIKQPNELPMDTNKTYEFSVVMTDADNQEASATTYIGLYADYPELVVGADNDSIITVWGSIYQKFDPFNFDAPELKLADLPATDSNRQKVDAKAGSNGETVGSVTQIQLVNNALPEGVDPYTGQLEVRLPVPTALADLNEGDTVNVYVVDDQGNVTVKEGVIDWSANPNSNPAGEPFTDEDGNDIPAVLVAIENTGVNLGAFGVGVPVKGSYTVNATVVGGGQISPAGEKIVPLNATDPLVYSAYAVTPHYRFSGFTLKVNGTTKTINDADLGYNNITIKPSTYGINDGDKVELTATFVNANPGGGTKTVEANLTNEAGASGSYTVSTVLVKGMVDGNGSPISLSGTTLDNEPVTAGHPLYPAKRVDTNAGLLLQFAPAPESYVKSVYISRNNGTQKPVAFQGNSLLLGTVTDNLRIYVTYAPGTQPEIPTKTISVSVKQGSTGAYPASIPNESGSLVSKASYVVGAGGAKTINAQPYKDIYELKHVYVYSPPDSTTPTDIIRHVYVSPNDVAHNYPADEITLYNVAEDARIELEYGIIPATIGGAQVVGGEWGWIIPDDDDKVEIHSDSGSTTGPSRMRVAAMAVTPAAQSIGARAGETYTQGTIQLKEEGGWARLVVRPDNGYEVGDVLVNGSRVNNLLTKRTDSKGDCYTLVVYLGGAGTADPSLGILASDPTGPVDKIFYLNTSTVRVDMTFNASIIEMPTFNLITTSVTEFGGGTITPNRNVEDGQDVAINFFPDSGYRVDKVWVGTQVVYQYDEKDTIMEDYINDGDDLQWSNNGLTMTIQGVSRDYTVRVAFAPGEQVGSDKARCSITATAGAGGSITPYGNFTIFAGTNQKFTLVPNTGYDISTVTVNGVEKTDKDGIFTSRNTIELKNVTQDTQVAVTFKPYDSSNSAAYTVTPTKEGKGRINPSSGLTVGAGADATFTVIPEKDWYVSDIRAVYSTASGRTEVSLLSLYDKSNFTFRLTDVREDTIIRAVFAEGEDGKTNTGEPVPTPPGDDKKIHLGDLSYPSDNPGAVVSPSLSELEIIKQDGTDHAVAAQTFTVTVMDGYELEEPILEEGIVVKDGSGNSLPSVMGSGNGSDGKVVIEQIADGVYTVTVPKEQVKDGLYIELQTHPKTASTEVSDLKKIKLTVAGSGYVTPGMTGVGSEPQILEVQKGKNQSFSFFPSEGWKVYTVYVNGVPNTVSRNFLTLHDIQQDENTVEVVFSKLEAGETPVNPPTYTINIQSSVQYSPMSKAVKVVEGSSLTISTNPDKGYKVKATDNGKPITVKNNAIEIGNIKADHNIVIEQEQIVTVKYQNLVVSSTGPGTTSPAGTSLVVEGQSQTITLIPDAGKKVKSVSVNGVNMVGRVVSDTMSITLDPIETETMVVVEFCEPAEVSEGDPGYFLPPPDTSIAYHTVTTSAPKGGGVVSPASATVAHDGSVDLTVMPNNGYELESIYVGNEDRTSFVSDNTLTVRNIKADTSVRANFVKSNSYQLDDFYTLFVEAQGDNGGHGSVSPEGALTVAAGGSQVLTLMPDPGSKVSLIEAYHNGVLVSKVENLTTSSYTFFNVTQDMNIIIHFAKGAGGANVLTHDIKATSTVEGRISPEGTVKVANGQNASFTFVPNPGYKLSYVKIDGTSIPAQYILNNQYIFTNVYEDHSLHAVFVEQDTNAANFATITIPKVSNGVITPSQSIVVEKGSTETIQITPFYGYGVQTVTITEGEGSDAVTTTLNVGTDGMAQSGNFRFDNGTLTLTNVRNNMRVTAAFQYVFEGSNKDDTPTYIPVSGTTTGEGGAGGTTILGNGGYVASPNFNAEQVGAAELHPQITITPNPDSMIDEVTLTYGDGSKVVVDDKGSYVYDKDGNLLDGPYEYNLDGTLKASNGKPVVDAGGNPVKYPSKGSRPTSTDINTIDIYELGYMEMDGIKAVITNGINCDVKFRPLTDQEKADIADGSLNPATYVEVNATYSGGGRMWPEGRVKAAKGQDLVVQFMPSNGYELASVTVDGRSVIDEVMSYATRTYIFESIQGNHTIDCTFAYVGTVVEYFDVTASSSAGGSVSPASASVPEGAETVVYFFPEEGYKVNRVLVNGEDITDTGANLQYMYIASNVTSDLDVYVEYAWADSDEATWTVTPVDITASCPAGNGEVSPGTATVPAGSPQTFFFKPASGYIVDYVIFNGVPTTLKDNPSSYTVTPSVGTNNELEVFFREATARDKRFFNLTPELTAGSKATIEPSGMTVEAGSTVTFYISPDTGNTLDTVTVDGWPVSFKPALADGVEPKPNAEYTMYIATIENVQPNMKVQVTTKPSTKTPLKVEKHTMTIKGENVLYAPMGNVQVPEGGSQIINVTPLSGYYLDSVIVKDKGTNNEIDMTDNLKANQISVPMGAYDREVTIKYLPVGAPSTSTTPAHITIGNTKTDKGDDVNATIAMRYGTDGQLSPLRVDPDTRMLTTAKRDESGNIVKDENGETVYEPIDFTRGSSPTFYVSAESSDGKDLVLTTATYNGNEQVVPELTGMIPNMKIHASGILDLVFRELKEGESLIASQKYDVEFHIEGQGTVDPSNILADGDEGGVSIPLGGNTGAITLIPAGENWMIGSVSERRYTNVKNEYGVLTRQYADDEPIPVDPRLYADSKYICTPRYFNTEVWVRFVPCTLVDVSWDDSLGFVAPNPSVGEPLKVEVDDPNEEQPCLFFVAPYEECYVEAFTVQHGDGDLLDYYYDLEQNQAALDYLSGYDIKEFEEGAGVVDPNHPERANGEGGNEANTFAVMAMDTREYNAQAIENNGSVPEAGAKFQNAYSVLTALDPTRSTVNVGLYTTRAPEYQQFTIRVVQPTSGGRIEPAGDVVVNGGGTQYFNLFADNGYTLKRVLVDGNPTTGYSLATNYWSFPFTMVDGKDHTLTAEFGPISNASDSPSRLLRVASSLARTGDLTGPAVGALLIVAAAGLAVTAISYIRRQQRRRRRTQGRA